MPIRTKESLQQLFAASRLRQKKKQQEEQLKYRKAQEAVKKALADKLSTKDEITPLDAQYEPLSRVIPIYNTRYVERHTADDDLYVTREQLKEAEQRGEGKIKWDKFDELVNKTKKELKKK